MKIKIEFELDLSSHPLNIKTIKDFRLSSQELSSWLNEFILNFHLKILEAHGLKQDTEEEKAFKEYMIKKHEEGLSLAEQIFDNYKLTGRTEDGDEFEFIHLAPYNETLKINGKESDLY